MDSWCISTGIDIDWEMTYYCYYLDTAPQSELSTKEVVGTTHAETT